MLNQAVTSFFKFGVAQGVVLVALTVLVPFSAAGQTQSLLSPYQLYADARIRNDLKAAAEYADQALAATVLAFGPEAPETGKALGRLGDVNQRLGKLDEAEQQVARALSISEQRLGGGHPDLVPLLEKLAAINRQQRKFAKAADYLQRVLSIERATYGENHEIVVATLTELRELYQEAGNADEVAGIDMQLLSATAVARDLDFLGDDSHRYDADDGYATVRVFYGTDRARTGDKKPAQFYGGDRGELELGYVDISIPETHKYGALESESQFSIFTYVLGDEAKKRRYVLLQTVKPLARDGFYSQLSGYIDNSPTNDVFVFIHGYNVTFEDAARRAGQLAYDLDFDGTPMMYSWPSQGSTAGYTVDEAVVRLSGRKLSRLLDGVVHETGAERIHLVAHSMGNRALIEALQAYVLKYGKDDSREVFDQVVLTAPDVDRDYFIEMMGEISGVARRTTLYASNNDLALKSSRILHGATRAGLAGTSIVSLPVIDTIDMSGIDADVLGHSYFAVSEGAIYDLFRLFWRDDNPAQRCSMSEQKAALGRFWQFDLDKCRGSNLLEAGLLYKRFGKDALSRLRKHIAEIGDDEEKKDWTLILDRVNDLIDTL